MFTADFWWMRSVPYTNSGFCVCVCVKFISVWLILLILLHFRNANLTHQYYARCIYEYLKRQAAEERVEGTAQQEEAVADSRLVQNGQHLIVHIPNPYHSLCSLGKG